MQSFVRCLGLSLLLAAVAMPILMSSASDAQQNSASFIAECDRLAASDLDLSRPGNVQGVAFPLIYAAAAVPACEGAVKADAKNARLYFQLGRSFAAARQYDNAFKALTIAAELGSLPAVVELGRAHRLGRNVPKDSAQARAVV